jgi:ergothioneine biosynthesis protein EgtB
VGHLEAFDWNLFHQRALALKPFHAEFDQLFAFGIDPVGGGLPADQPKDWPAQMEVRNYVNRVRQALDAGLEAALQSGAEHGEFPVDLLLEVAIEHRLMHAETLAYMFHQLALEQKVQYARIPEAVVPAVTPAMIEIPAGTVTLGLPHTDRTFGWDNEYEAHVASVPAFSIDRYMVSNGQYLDFMVADGYVNRDLWSEADWTWKTEHGITHPIFWKPRDHRWHYRTMFDELPLPLDWPVYVSHAEASAYARWAGKALPTEAQWQRAAFATPDGGERLYPWGNEAPRPEHGNFDFERWDPTPVGAFPQGESAFGVSDLLGNGWEWTSTLFAPFAGFERFAFYPGYSADFFDGKHYVMKGGSPRTAACMLRRSFRNWFQPHYQYVYAGFRCVTNR